MLSLGCSRCIHCSLLRQIELLRTLVLTQGDQTRSSPHSIYWPVSRSLRTSRLRELILVHTSLASRSEFDALKALQDQNLVPDAIKIVLTNYADSEYRSMFFAWELIYYLTSPLRHRYQ